MAQFNDGGPAFPQLDVEVVSDHAAVTKASGGASLRDYFAAAATEEDIQEWIPATQGTAIQLAATIGIDSTDWANACRRLRCWARYQHADAMLAEREKRYAQS